jgi:hypothetical protein
MAKLHERSGDRQERIEEMLDKGELQQFCVQVKRSHELEDISREFVVTRMGYGST